MKSELKKQVWNKTNGKCYYCGTQTVPFGSAPDSFCVDHVIPRTRNGTDDIENLVPACFSCNITKSSKGLFNWASEMVNENGERTGMFYFELMRLPFPVTAWNDPL